MELHTDAGEEGIGAVLAQRFDKDPTEHAVAYARRTLSNTERNYTTAEKECLQLFGLW